MEFTKLETDIFNWIKRKYNNPILSKQINEATFKSREYTKVGFFIELNVPKSNEKLTIQNLKGPIINSDEIEYNGGSVLFIKDGYLSVLELYANGSFFKENISNYKLEEL